MNLVKAKVAALWKPYSTGTTLLIITTYTFWPIHQKFQKPSVFDNNFTCWLLLDVPVYFPLHSIKFSLSIIYCQSSLNTTPEGTTALLNMNHNKFSGLCDANLNLLTLLMQSTSWALFIFKSMLSYNYIPNYLMELNFSYKLYSPAFASINQNLPASCHCFALHSS